MKNSIWIALVSLFLFSCDSLADYEKEALYGRWEAVEWKKMNSGELISGEVFFAFEEDGRYKAKYGDNIEKGRYWIVSDNLHTVEEGMAEKKVKIEKLTADTLVFGMNRMGQLEQLTLLRKN